MDRPFNNSGRAIAIHVVHNSTAGIALLFVSLRLYARIFRGKNAGWDDLCIAIAMGGLVFASATAPYFVGNGIGQPVLKLTLHEVEEALKWLYIVTIANWSTLCLVRMSVGFFLLRLLPTTSLRNKIYRWLIMFLMAYNFALTLTIDVVFGMQCQPYQAFWDFQLRAKSKCFTPDTVIMILRLFSSLSAVIDIAFALLPLTVIKSLQMKRQTKIVLIACMSLGVLTAGCAVAKAILTTTIFVDPTYNLFGEIMAAILEANIGVIAASLPGMLQFCLIVRDDWRSYKSKRTSDLEKGRSSTLRTKWSTRPSTKPGTSDTAKEVSKDFATEIQKRTEITVQHLTYSPEQCHVRDHDYFEDWSSRNLPSTKTSSDRLL